MKSYKLVFLCAVISPLIILNTGKEYSTITKVESANESILISDNLSSNLHYQQKLDGGEYQEDINIYTDESGNYYYYGNESGNFIGYFESSSSCIDENIDIDIATGYGTTSENKSKFSKAQLQSIGEDCLAKYITITDYVIMEDFYNSESEIYTFNYYKKIKGYKCADCASVRVNCDGTIISFATPNIGLFDNVNVPNIEENDIQAYIKNQVKNQYGNTLVNYEIINEILCLSKDKKCAMKVAVYVTLSEYTEEINYTILLE